MGAVRRFCHRAMLMERGRIVELGDPEHVGGAYLELNFQGEQLTDAAPPGPHAGDANRRGDGRAEILDMWFEDAHGAPISAIPQNEDVIVKAVMRFHAAMEHPSVGIAVEDADQRIVLACNTLWVDERTGVYCPGDEATVTLRFRNVFTPGRYFVSPAVAKRGTGLELADHRIRLDSFVSTGTLVSGGLVDLDHDMRVARGAEPAPVAAEPEAAAS